MIFFYLGGAILSLFTCGVLVWLTMIHKSSYDDFKSREYYNLASDSLRDIIFAAVGAIVFALFFCGFASMVFMS